MDNRSQAPMGTPQERRNSRLPNWAGMRPHRLPEKEGVAPNSAVREMIESAGWAEVEQRIYEQAALLHVSLVRTDHFVDASGREALAHSLTLTGLFRLLEGLYSDAQMEMPRDLYLVLTGDFNNILSKKGK